MCFKQHRVRYQRSRKAPGIKPLDILNDEQQKEKHAASQFFSSLLEAYSRVTNPERFASLHDVAAELLDRLELEFDAERAEGYGLDPELEEGCKLARPSVRLVPRERRCRPHRRHFLGLPRGPRPLRALVLDRFPDLRMRCVR